MIEDDVLVIGGGLAGSMAALTAAREGVRVRILSASESTLRSASGLIDVLGYAPDGGGPLADPFGALADLPGGHPYERAGEAAVRAGLGLFDDAVEGYRGSRTDRNALIPTHGGTVKPTARYPDAVRAGLASDGRECLLVGFGSLPDFDAPLAAARLEASGVPFPVRGVTVPFPVDLRADAAATRYARALDRDEADVRGDLAEAVRPHLGGAGRVGFPALLGHDDPGGVRAALEADLGADVFEVPMGPPSLPGVRLARRLDDALDGAGVRATTGNPAVGFEAEGDRIRSVVVDRSGARIPHGAREFVLATGGLVGKGIASDRGSVSEPIFGCRVPHPADRYDWFDDGVYGDHPFARFGVDVDRGMRPLDAGGDPEFPNLRAAGAVVGGADFPAEKSGSGVSIATGYAAGRRAGENA